MIGHRRGDDRHGGAVHAAGRRDPVAQPVRRAGTVDTVIVVELPHSRAFMHLDTVMTMIDRDAFCVYPYLPEQLRSFTLTRRRCRR